MTQAMQAAGDATKKIVRHSKAKKPGTAVAVAARPPATLEAMIQQAANGGKLDVLERLLAMKERLDAHNAEKMFNVALAKAQAQVRAVLRNRKNDSTKSNYATYAALDKMLRPILIGPDPENPVLSVTFDTGEAPGALMVRVLARLAHTAGHGRDYHVDIPADGKGAKGGDVMTLTHATGSAIAYGRRYLLQMIFNIPTIEREDDDGNQAGGKIIEVLSDDQLKRLLAKLDQFGKKRDAAESALLNWLGVDSTQKILAKDFDRMMRGLTKKLNPE